MSVVLSQASVQNEIERKGCAVKAGTRSVNYIKLNGSHHNEIKIVHRIEFSITVVW